MLFKKASASLDPCEGRRCEPGPGTEAVERSGEIETTSDDHALPLRTAVRER